MKTMKTVCLAALTLMAVLATGCDAMDGLNGKFPASMPDLNFANLKADSASSNTIIGNRLNEGTALSGKLNGYMAFPMWAQAGEFIPLQAYTSEPSVVFVFGPQVDRDWDLEQIRALSEGIEPGVETRRLNFEAPESGEYLVVIGSVEERESDWIIARGAPPTH